MHKTGCLPIAAVLLCITKAAPGLSREDMDKLCAWIDLVIPFCGDYVEANAWSEAERASARQRLELRKQADQRDLHNIAAMLQAGQ